jgi:hypothetical protein
MHLAVGLDIFQTVEKVRRKSGKSVTLYTRGFQAEHSVENGHTTSYAV